MFTNFGQMTTDNNFFYSVIGEKVAIKAMQKSRITDYEAFQNEISILRSLVRSR